MTTASSHSRTPPASFSAAHVPAWLGCILATVAASGCTGHARLSLIPLNSSTLTPTSRLEYTVSPQECYWWVDEEDRLCLAMCYHNFSILGDLTRDAFELSFVFKDPPPEEEKVYVARRDVARALWHRSAWHLRLRARTGNVAIERRSEEILAGRLRLTCSSEEFWILTGWQRKTPVLIQGQFTAVRNAKQGRALLQRIEETHPRGNDSGKVTFEPGG